ncbi:hypothetical protein ACFL0V_03715 [Nanoarchaeota archaeon]
MSKSIRQEKEDELKELESDLEHLTFLKDETRKEFSVDEVEKKTGKTQESIITRLKKYDLLSSTSSSQGKTHTINLNAPGKKKFAEIKQQIFDCKEWLRNDHWFRSPNPWLFNIFLLLLGAIIGAVITYLVGN